MRLIFLFCACWLYVLSSGGRPIFMHISNRRRNTHQNKPRLLARSEESPDQIRSQTKRVRRPLRTASVVFLSPQNARESTERNMRLLILCRSSMFFVRESHLFFSFFFCFFSSFFLILLNFLKTLNVTVVVKSQSLKKWDGRRRKREK